MSAAFFVTLREGLEAVLIVGIIAAYLVKVGRRDALRQVALGVIAAAVVATVVGVAVAATIGRLPLVVQETFEGAAAMGAVVVLTWMLFWMRRQGRALKGGLEAGVAEALGRGHARALVGLAFLAVVREGLETVLFLLAVLGASGDTVGALTWAVIGLLVATAIGWAIFAAGVRIDLRRFFSVTSVLLIFVAAGLSAYAVRALTEAGWLPLTAVAFDLAGLLPERGPVGSVLAGLFGYRAAPTITELAAYVAYLVPVLALFVWPSLVTLGRRGSSDGGLLTERGRRASG
jgi:high-affinity iron transporter